MRLLVTGGAGFIGSHFLELALARGHNVVALDDLSTGSLENLSHSLEDERLRFVEGSACDAALVGRLVDESDVVIHLAAAVGVKLIIDRPVDTIRTNVIATETVLEAAARRRVTTLLASTSEVYGKGATLPFREDMDLVLGPTTHSRWSYACSKALDEWLTLAYNSERGLPVVVARLFNTVGPRQTGRYGMVLPTFARQAVAGEPITVHGSGEQTRAFAHVRDVVEALLALALSERAHGQVVNVGTDEEISILSLAERVRAAAGSASPIVRVPYDEAYAEGFEDMARRVPDLTRLEELLGFRPRTSLQTILTDVVAFERARAARG